MYAFSGTYKIDGNKITISINNSWNRAWNGTKLSGEIEVAGDKYTYTSTPIKSAKEGLEVIFVHTYEKVE
jgi:hypothetical protein